MYENGGAYQFVSPILIIGIALLVLPAICEIFRFHIPNFISGLGFVVIIIGGFHSIYKAVN